MDPIKEYTLSDPERTALADLEQQAQAAVRAAEQQSIGMLRLILQQQGLKGNWHLSEDKTKLVEG
jgi:hypothetical protein